MAEEKDIKKEYIQTMEEIAYKEASKGQEDVNEERINKALSIVKSLRSDGSQGIEYKTTGGRRIHMPENDKNTIDKKNDESEKSEPFSLKSLTPEELVGIGASLEAEKLQSPDMRLAQATFRIKAYTDYMNATRELGDSVGQYMLDTKGLTGGERFDELMNVAGQRVQKSGVRTGAYDEASKRGAPQMDKPKLPQRDKEILSQMTTAVIGDIMKSALAGIAGGDAPYMASMAPSATEQTATDLSGLLQSDMDKFDARKERIDAINFEMMVRHQDNLSTMKANIDAKLDAADTLYNNMKFNEAKSLADTIVQARSAKEEGNAKASGVMVQAAQARQQTEQFNVSQKNQMEHQKTRLAMDIRMYDIQAAKAAKANNWSVQHLALQKLVQTNAAEDMGNNFAYASTANGNIANFAVKYANSRNIYDQINYSSGPYMSRVVKAIYEKFPSNSKEDNAARKSANQNMLEMFNAGFRPQNISSDFLTLIGATDYTSVIQKGGIGGSHGEQDYATYQKIIKDANVVKVLDDLAYKNQPQEIKDLVKSIDVLNFTTNVGNNVFNSKAQADKQMEAQRLRNLEKKGR